MGSRGDWGWRGSQELAYDGVRALGEAEDEFQLDTFSCQVWPLARRSWLLTSCLPGLVAYRLEAGGEARGWTLEAGG